MNDSTTVSWVRAVDDRSTIEQNNRISSDPTNRRELPYTEEVKGNIHNDLEGALGKLTNSTRELAAAILRPQNHLVSGKAFETSAYLSRSSISTSQSGAALGIRKVIGKYARSAREGQGPPVKYVDGIESFHNDLSVLSPIDSLRENRRVDAAA